MASVTYDTKTVTEEVVVKKTKKVKEYILRLNEREAKVVLALTGHTNLNDVANKELSAIFTVLSQHFYIDGSPFALTPKFYDGFDIDKKIRSTNVKSRR